MIILNNKDISMLNSWCFHGDINLFNNAIVSWYFFNKVAQLINVRNKITQIKFNIE